MHALGVRVEVECPQALSPMSGSGAGRGMGALAWGTHSSARCDSGNIS